MDIKAGQYKAATNLNSIGRIRGPGQWRGSPRANGDAERQEPARRMLLYNWNKQKSSDNIKAPTQLAGLWLTITP